MKYAVKIVNNKIISYQLMPEKYLDTFKDDKSNPLNNGYTLVDSLKNYIIEIPKESTEKECILSILSLTENDLSKVKQLK